MPRPLGDALGPDWLFDFLLPRDWLTVAAGNPEIKKNNYTKKIFSESILPTIHMITVNYSHKLRLFKTTFFFSIKVDRRVIELNITSTPEKT